MTIPRPCDMHFKAIYRQIATPWAVKIYQWHLCCNTHTYLNYQIYRSIIRQIIFNPYPAEFLKLTCPPSIFGACWLSVRLSDNYGEIKIRMRNRPVNSTESGQTARMYRAVWLYTERKGLSLLVPAGANESCNTDVGSNTARDFGLFQALGYLVNLTARAGRGDFTENCGLLT